MENIEELLNGIKDFVEEQKELVDATGSLDRIFRRCSTGNRFG